MPVEYTWYNEEKSIVFFKFVDPWTTTEFSNCEAEVRGYMAQLDVVVDAILDFSDARVLPQNAFSYFISSVRKGEAIENEGATIVYGANMLLHAVGSSIGRITKTTDIQFASSLTEAENALIELKNSRALQAG